MHISDEKSVNGKDGIPLFTVRRTHKRYKNVPKFFIHEEGTGATNVEIPDGEVSPLPTHNSRVISYCFGASGSGKSTWISKFVDEWLEKHPKGEIYYFSRLNEDPAYEFEYHKVPITEDLIDDVITCDEIPEGSLTIFDDIDVIQPKKLNDAVQGILHDILETGRHRNISACISSHLGADHNKTKRTLNESHLITFYPHGSSSAQIRYVLKTYGGLTNKEVQHTLKLPSRWVTFKRSYPPVIMYSGGAYLLSNNEE